jgi:hypothetical protein
LGFPKNAPVFPRQAVVWRSKVLVIQNLGPQGILLRAVVRQIFDLLFDLRHGIAGEIAEVETQ